MNNTENLKMWFDGIPRNLEVVLDYCTRHGYVGCVYPSFEKSYYVNSGGDMELHEIQCNGGSFYTDLTY